MAQHTYLQAVQLSQATTDHSCTPTRTAMQENASVFGPSVMTRMVTGPMRLTDHPE